MSVVAPSKNAAQQLHSRSPEDLLAEAETASPARREELREQVVLNHLPLARTLAWRYRDKGEPIDDLIQVASLGLVKAVQGFRPGAGSSFCAYAVPTITGELRRHFRDRGWDVRPPRRIQELRANIYVAAAEMSQTIGRSPRADELAERLKVTVEDVVEALTAADNYSAVSLDAPVNDQEGSTLGEHLAEDDESLEHVVDSLAVRPLLAQLEPRDRRILTMRFFRGCTQQEIAAEIGVTQMQVSRLISQALQRLRAAAATT